MKIHASLAGIVAAILLLPPAARASLTDTASHPPPAYYTFTPPARGQSYVDPVFGTSIQRLSDATASPDNASGGNLVWVMNEYSTMAAFNQDDSRLILQHDSYYGLYDGPTGQYLSDLPFAVNAGSQPRWSRTVPTLLYYISGNQLASYDVASHVTTVLHTFGEYAAISGNGESDISGDGDHFVFAGDQRYVFTYRISTGTKGPVYDTGGASFDALYITPQNNVLISWYGVGTARQQGIELFDGNMVFQRQVTDTEGHMHLTRDTDGSEVLVWTNSADPHPICDNGVVKVNLASGEQTCLLSLDWSLAVHITCPDGNGSCYVDTEAPADPNPAAAWPAYTDELLQVKLDGSGTARLAHHRSRPLNTYNWEPRLTVSRDGSALLFSSDYGLQAIAGKPIDYADAYLIRLSAPPPAGGGPGSGGGTGGGSTVVRVQQGDPAVAYSGNWFTHSSSVLSGGSAALATDRGSSATLAFTGTGVKWIGYRDAWSGIARLTVDGVPKGRINTYAATDEAQKVIYSIQGLPRGKHTLTIFVTGQAGAAAKASWIWVDAFDVSP
jgi:hypothetical protein